MYILLALAGAAAAGIGSSLQKLGMSTKFPQLSLAVFIKQWQTVLATLFTNWIWMIGFVLGASKGFFVAQALSMGDVSVVQILANTTGLWTVCIGVAFFAERLVKSEWIGLAAMLTGAVLVSLSAEVTGSGAPNIRVLFIIAVVVAVAMLTIYLVNRRARKQIGLEFLLAAYAGLGFGFLSLMMKLVTHDVTQHLGKFHVLSGASWAYMASSPLFWLMLASVVPPAFFVQGAYAHGRVAMVTPVLSVGTTLITVTCAVLVFHETLQPLRMTGIALSMLGAVAVVGKKA